MENKNSILLKDFVRYCEKNPDLRFWQALVNWSGFHFIYGSKEHFVRNDEKLIDTYYIEGKNE